MLFFPQKYERARQLQRELRGIDEETERKEAEARAAEEALEEAEEAARAESEGGAKRKKSMSRRKKRGRTLDIEKGDVTAMLISAFTTLFIPAVLVLIGFGLLLFLIFWLF